MGAALLLLSVVAPVQAEPEGAREWILRMNRAVVESNYDGVIDHSFGEISENLRIIHRFKDREMTERVISMDGSKSEQKRKGSSWAQFHPDKRRVETATRNRSYGYIPTLNGLDDLAARHYDITDAGVERLVDLGREVQQIRIEPRDSLRFGYRLWIDRESGLPLKMQRVAHDGKVLKEIAFVSPPSLPADIPDDQLKVAVDFKDYRWVNRDLRTPFVNPDLKRSYAPQAGLLPAGYRVLRFNNPGRAAAEQGARSGAGPRARFIVSDGVSWADVFLVPASGEARPAGGSNMGSWASYQFRFEDVQVIVVGEMPLEAAKAIAEAIRPE